MPPIKDEGAPLAFSEIQDEFGEFDITSGLIEYWGAASTLPKIGEEIAFSDFYGAVDLRLSLTLSQSADTELEAAYAGRDEIVYAPQNVTVDSGTAYFGFTNSGLTDTQQESQGYRIFNRSGKTYYATGSGGSARLATQVKTNTTVTERLSTGNAGLHGWTASSPAEYVDGKLIWKNGSARRAQNGSYLDIQTSSDVQERLSTSIAAYNGWTESSPAEYVDGKRIWKNGTSRRAQNGSYLDIQTYTPPVTSPVVPITTSNFSQYGYTQTSIVRFGATLYTKNGTSTEFWVRPGTTNLATRVAVAGSDYNVTTATDFGFLRTTRTAYGYVIYRAPGDNVTDYYLVSGNIKSASFSVNRTNYTLAFRFSNGPVYSFNSSYATFYYIDVVSFNSENTFTSLTNFSGKNVYIQDPLTATVDWVRANTFSDGYAYGISNLNMFRNYLDGAYISFSSSNGTRLTAANKFYYYHNTYPSKTFLATVTRYSLSPVFFNVTRSFSYTNISDSITTPGFYTYTPSYGNRLVYSYTVSNSTRTKPVYTYTNVPDETRPTVTRIGPTPAYGYDLARKYLYRKSQDGGPMYETVGSWPRTNHFSNNWKSPPFAGILINQYYSDKMEMVAGQPSVRNRETFTAEGVAPADFVGDNIPARLTFDIGQGDASELSYDTFYRLYRSQRYENGDGAGVVVLGYISPQTNVNKPTFTATISGTQTNIGISNLDATRTYRLRWAAYQGAQFRAGSIGPAVSGVSDEFLGDLAPVLTLTGGDDQAYSDFRQGVDLYLEVQVSSLPTVVWAVTRCFEYFRNGENKLVEANCDFLDGFSSESELLAN